MITTNQLAAHAAWIAAGLPAGDQRQIVLRWANLQDADLRGADLRGADLRGATLRGANLRDADLRGADLCWASLRGASLRGASLDRAGLDRAGLDRADLCGARGITSAGPVGRERRIIYAVDHGDCVMIKTGCRWDTAEAVIEAIKADYADAPAMRDAYIATVRAMVATLEAQR